ncbi:hypothetical protein BD560DRAFT_407327 [Blakeslea trispora]|nr:hypothetical protein BD560DRAFT_407327 [Blakeslea trispora]
MATTMQHNPVLLQQEDEDIALANYLTTSLRINSQTSQQRTKSTHVHHSQQRIRVSSNASNHSMNKQKLSPPSSVSSHGSSTRPHPQRKPSPRPSHSHRHPSSQSHASIQSSSESIKSNHSNTSRRRQSTMPPPNTMPAPHSVERRSSIESTTSAFSTRSDMSMGTKLSLSKRLRKVFSMNNLKSASSTSLHNQNDLASLAGRNGSSSSVASSATAPLPQNTNTASSGGKSPMASLRRRSIASLSSLFQKATSSDPTPPPPTTSPPQSIASSNSSTSRRHSSGDLRQLAKEDKKRPDLRVDTTESSVSHTRKGGLKVRPSCTTNNHPYVNNGAPDSPNSTISARSFTRLPPQQRNGIHEPGLPSPTPSTASSKHDEDYMTKKPAAIGLQYGIGLHSSPRLKPASSSTSSLPNNTTSFNSERRVQFCTTIQVHETFAPSDYDRRCDTSATCQKLTPMSAMKIKQELNEFKLTEMDVHVESRQYTHFFL